MGIEFIRFDMSEYMERHTVSRLIGAPPGYVGFDQGGLLTEAITKHPHCVLLLDEIEKAHPDVFNLLLQVMDHGTLTDNNGRKADFRHVIIIMTTNAGAQEMNRPRSASRTRTTPPTAWRRSRLFSPEFRNRLDAVIQFAPLDPVDHRAGGGQAHHRGGGAAGAEGRVMTLEDAARRWIASRATTRRWAPVRWRASSRRHQASARRGAAVRAPRHGGNVRGVGGRGRVGTVARMRARAAVVPPRAGRTPGAGLAAAVDDAALGRSYGVISTVTASPVRMRM